MTTCAFIGLGVMGYPMAGHLVAAGHEVTVYNRTASRAEDWVAEHGGTAAETPAGAAADAEFVFLCVGDDPDVLAVTTGDGGVLESMAKGTHNGGHIEFGPDGYLYVALGDGGPANDPEDRAQRLSSLFGKILRIDPQPGSEPAYLIPDDNPFVTVDGAAGEVWAYGLRNPWRFSFDRANGDFYTGDVGQYVVEEINYVESGVAGANFGWARLEGPIQRGATPPDHVAPLSFYNHDDGRCAIVAGIVYRGTAIPELRGAFIYGDYCDGQVRAMTQIDGEVVATRTLGIFTGQLTGFAQDLGGELYVFNLAGETLKIVPG